MPDSLYNLTQIAELAYRWGDCQAILYDPVREDLFPPPYLLFLYNLCRRSGRAKMGILEPLFCGMRDLSQEGICAFLHAQKLVILGEWRKGENHLVFSPLGFCFLTTLPNRGAAQSSAFGGYAFFREAWRTPQQLVLTFLGIAFLFQENKLSSLHGIRYADNKLTARWMSFFGFQDLGTVPNYLFRPSLGELVAATVSTLSRAEFESRLSQALEEGMKLEGEDGRRQGQGSQPGSAEHPSERQPADGNRTDPVEPVDPAFQLGIPRLSVS